MSIRNIKFQNELGIEQIGSKIQKKQVSPSKRLLTEEQSNVSNQIIEFINSDYDETKVSVALIGGAGVGKTFVTNYIISNSRIPRSLIACTAPTHKACRVFGNNINSKVETIQSTFGLRLNLNLIDFDAKNPQFDPIGEIKIKGKRLLIIDEASMLSYKLVNYIVKTCITYRVKILFIGDSYQLNPVNEHRSTAFDVCHKVLELKTIIRQTNNNPIIELASIIRNDIKNKKLTFINKINEIKAKSGEIINNEGNGITILSKKEFAEKVATQFRNEEFQENIEKYKLVAYTNNCVVNWNNFIRKNIIKDSDLGVLTRHDLIMSYQTIVDDFNQIIINNSEEYIIHDIVSFTDKNHIKGYLVKFQKIYGGDITPPLFIIDHRDQFSVLKYHNMVTELYNSARNSHKNVRAKKWKEYYKFKNNNLLINNILNRDMQIIHNRDIDYGFAITAHRSQGSTYENVFIDLNDMLYDKNGKPYSDLNELLRRVYVAISRASKNIFICYD